MSKNYRIVNNEISDGYHTFNELYEHRNLLFLNLCLSDRKNSFWKPDYPGHFCLYWESPKGQMSYHLGNELLPLIEGKIDRDDSHTWDLHKSKDVIRRLTENARDLK